ncbi:MAG: ATP-binding cassette domain-containing protein [Fidelibacterota bacterium]|nr:MAG: ATP-binding cassette domain-containing protein [Candidatus Neomarinimicrobiota bacterium]
MNTVDIEQVTKTFGQVTAVDNLSLSVPQGSIYGFIGPNGAGKTTTLRMIMNIFWPDSGTILVFGEELQGAGTDRIGYLPEERGLYKKMKVRELLQFYGELKNGKGLRRDVDRWLERLDLSNWANKRVETLSKGMSQKVQFIAAVVSLPDLIILDEPFTGLDPVNTDVIREAILEIRAQGTTVIFSTHDMNVAERMCDYIFMIHKGRKVLDGTLTAIQDEYGSDTIRIRTEDDAKALQNLDGIEKINDFGQLQELRMTRGYDPQQVLAAVISRTRITSFEVARPSLHDIFVRIAAPEAEEESHAQDT